MPPRRTRKKAANGQRRPAGNSRSGGNNSILIIGLLIVLTLVAGIGVYLYNQSLEKNQSVAVKAKKLARENPDAEVFMTDDTYNAAPAKKKVVPTVTAPKPTPAAPRTSSPEPAPVVATTSPLASAAQPEPQPEVAVAAEPIVETTPPPTPAPATEPPPAPENNDNNGKIVPVQPILSNSGSVAVSSTVNSLTANPVTRVVTTSSLAPSPQASQPAEPPVRAQAVEAPNAPVTEMDYAVWQVQMERQNFSCGTIDGDFGMRSKRSITQYQKSRGLPVTGALDIETRMSLGTPGNPFMQYTVTAEDMAQVNPPPAAWRDKAKATFLGYKNVWEMLAGKFHSSEEFMRKLNPGIKTVAEGTILTAPNLEPAAPIARCSKIVIILSETTMLLYDKNGKLQACFPCSIAADKNKRPNGQLSVVTGALNPNYTFNPEVLKEAAQREGITNKIIIPPGPNNPVGLAWVSLSLPGYGIHGTPDPQEISRSGSHGCFRLANWNAVKVFKSVTRGTPVEVIE